VRDLSDLLVVEVVEDPECRALRALAEFLIDAAMSRLQKEDQESNPHA